MLLKRAPSFVMADIYGSLTIETDPQNAVLYLIVPKLNIVIVACVLPLNVSRPRQD